MTARIQPEVANDWAERLALEIALDMHRHGTQDACNLTAARLRLVKAEGERDGINQATRAIVGGAS